jgi:hypothetical protein
MKALAHFILVTLFLTSCSFLGNKNSSYTGPETDEKVLAKNSKCAYKLWLTTDQRKKLYPFEQAKKILLISFDDPTQPQDKIPTKDNRLNYPKLKQVKELDTKEADSLSSLLYNVGVNDKSKDTIIDQASCYNPKHSIAFLDKDDQIIDYIEICFTCNRLTTKTDKVREIEMCSIKYEIMKEFFKQFGFKFE